ncbi:MAG TPA: hypothetical protein DIU48_13905 [Acidobacteria bacterium]|nr:hypothetical protein [Acidobacteriota bacterium]
MALDNSYPQSKSIVSEPVNDACEPNSAEARFKTCRWHAEDGEWNYCSNRDVLPYAGKGGFNAEAWCPDCAFYKLRRTPKKHPQPDVDNFAH